MSMIPDPALSAQSKQPATIAIAVILPVLSGLVVSLRLYTRLAILGLPGADDWLVLVAWFLAVGTSIEVVLEVHWGLGFHIWVISPDQMMEQMKASTFPVFHDSTQFTVLALYASILNYNLANNALKMSFLLQYRRIFGLGCPMADRFCRWMFYFVLFWAVVQAVLLGLSCIPIATIIPSMADKCLRTLPIWYISSALNIVMDFTILAVPLPCLYNLTMPSKQKILVFSIFSLGFFTCIISVIRLVYITIVTKSEDPTWDNVELTLWSVAEINCGIICASLQTLRPFLARFAPTLLSSIASSVPSVRICRPFRDTENWVAMEDAA